MATEQKDRVLGVRVDARTREWLEKMARKHDRNISWVIRSSIEYARLLDEGKRPTTIRRLGVAAVVVAKVAAESSRKAGV